MSKVVSVTAEAQSPVVYADAYAIMTKPTIHDDDDDVIMFVSRKGTTSWPCAARLFDDAASAMTARFALGLPDAQVVRLTLQYVAEAVEMVSEIEILEKKPAIRRRRVA
jgi:hypothetical protein